MAEEIVIPTEGDIPLPNGCRLYWQPDEVGGREYFTDEVGGGCRVWITSLVDISTMIAAVTQEFHLRKMEQVKADRDKAKQT